MYEPEVTVNGKRYKVLTITATMDVDDINRRIGMMCDVDLKDKLIDDITEKLKEEIIKELSRTDALNETTRKTANGGVIHTMTLLALEELPDREITVNGKIDWAYITNNTTKPAVYNKTL